MHWLWALRIYVSNRVNFHGYKPSDKASAVFSNEIEMLQAIAKEKGKTYPFG